ncbi:MAG: histidinol-phosphatase [Myxococcales bacterium]|nr:histidinol-phosphatase [Myxococcales bacterium]
MDAEQLDQRLEAAVSIAEAAGPIALNYFRSPLAVDDKSAGGAFDPVTAADREIERQMREQIAARYPEDGIYGEEEGGRAGASGLRWIIDPIDGTRAFMSGMPAWGILLGCVEGERCLAGVVHQPFLGETFTGAGGRAEVRDARGTRALQTRASARLGDALLYTTDPSMFPEPAEQRAYEALVGACRMRRFGGDCYAYCLLALGCIDLVVEGQLKPYDILPLIPIVEGAGGVVSDWEGGAAHAGGRIVAAANPELHAQALGHLRNVSS